MTRRLSSKSSARRSSEGKRQWRVVKIDFEERGMGRGVGSGIAGRRKIGTGGAGGRKIGEENKEVRKFVGEGRVVGIDCRGRVK